MKTLKSEFSGKILTMNNHQKTEKWNLWIFRESSKNKQIHQKTEKWNLWIFRENLKSKPSN